MKINRIFKEWRLMFLRKLTGKHYGDLNNNSESERSLSRAFQMIITSDKQFRNIRNQNNDDIEMLINEDEENCINLKEPIETYGFDKLELVQLVDIREPILADCRSYEEKKLEINDEKLNFYLSHELSKKRRNAVCEKMLKQDKDPLFEYIVFLLREEHIKNFLL
jgi:hypothetical protein